MIHAITRASEERASIDSGRRQARLDSIEATITKAQPRSQQDSRKNSGSSGVCQYGWSLGPASSISDPSDDWCIDGSTTAIATIHGSARSSSGVARSAMRFSRLLSLARQLSRIDGATSSQRKMMYVEMQTATSSNTDRRFQPLTINSRQKFHGRPMSMPNVITPAV